MLKIIDYDSAERMEEPCVLMLGYFDGMHIGHRALLHAAMNRAAKENLKVGVMTFYGGKKGGQIYVFEERVRLFESLGADFALAARFDDAFRRTEKQDFLRAVFATCNVRALVCGEDFTFGRDAAGTAEDVKRAAFEHGASLTVLPLVGIYEHKAAASLAKEYLAAGDVEKLNQLLGGRYFVAGRVSTEGRRVGSKLGFPTANLHLSNEKFPLRQGVYAVSVPIGGREFRGIANYGARPTFGDERVVLEVYLDGYKGDLYGEEIVVYFDGRLRDIRKFESADAHKAQLKIDLEKIR